MAKKEKNERMSICTGKLYCCMLLYYSVCACIITYLNLIQPMRGIYLEYQATFISGYQVRPCALWQNSEI